MRDDKGCVLAYTDVSCTHSTSATTTTTGVIIMSNATPCQQCLTAHVYPAVGVASDSPWEPSTYIITLLWVWLVTHLPSTSAISPAGTAPNMPPMAKMAMEIVISVSLNWEVLFLNDSWMAYDKCACSKVWSHTHLSKPHPVIIPIHHLLSPFIS